MHTPRWPAEWEPHAATWLAWPQNPDTWPGHLAEARREFAEIVRALQGRERVRLLVDDEPTADAARRDLAAAGVDPDDGIDLVVVPTNDAWLRDSGPLFVEWEGEGERRCVALDFGFDAWGGKYPPWDLDDAVPRRAAELLGVERREPGFVLEGGSIDGNGRGTLLTTESCLLAPNREPGRTREGMEERLARWLGARRVVWLGEGIAGDDTDGHVDDFARFVSEDTVVAAVAEPGHPSAGALEANLERLRGARDADGRPLSVVPLPMPPPHRVDGELCPASHANFYLANGVALVPTFGAATDARALALLADLLPGREVVGIPCGTLVLGLGAVHCLSRQQPLC